MTAFFQYLLLDLLLLLSSSRHPGDVNHFNDKLLSCQFVSSLEIGLRTGVVELFNLVLHGLVLESLFSENLTHPALLMLT